MVVFYNSSSSTPMCFWPPMSQTLSLKPADWTDLMLKPCVGVIELTSSDASCLSAIVLSELSREHQDAHLLVILLEVAEEREETPR